MVDSILEDWQDTRAPILDAPKHLRIRIAVVQICAEALCDVLSDRHLKIEVRDVALDGTAAVAISYTWGEFERKSRPVGHDATGQVIQMELGEEWVLDEFEEKLVMLSDRHGGCWVDQLCVPQGAEAVRKALADIPAIYRALEVVALMPGSPCGCLQESSEAMLHVLENPESTREERNAAWSRWNLAMQTCVSSAGMNSYFDRVWTRQELFYSRRISRVWTSDAQAECVRNEEQRGSLGRFATLLYQERLKEGFSTALAYQDIEAANYMFLRSATAAMTGYCAYDQYAAHSDTAMEPVLVRFLSGGAIENKQPVPQDRPVHERLRTFLYQLAQFGESRRRATKARDYVTSVWADCPGYVIPENYRTLSLPALLEDAIVQMERNFGSSVTSTAPAGLFGMDEASGLWRPTASMEVRDELDASQVYGAVLKQFKPVPVYRKAIPIHSLGDSAMSISSRVREYGRHFEGQTTAQVFIAMQRVVQQWGAPVQSKLALKHLLEKRRVRAVGKPDDALLVDIFEKCLLGIAPRREWGALPEIDHEAAIRRLVIDALGLSARKCEEHDLRLMVSLEDPPCIGLVKPEICQQDYFSDYKERVKRYTGTTATACIDRGERDNGCALYETTKLHDGRPSTLIVTGVWVPFRNASFHDIAGFAREFAMDARIGNPADVEDLPETRLVTGGKRMTLNVDEAFEDVPQKQEQWKVIFVIGIIALVLSATVLPLFLSPEVRHPDSEKVCPVPENYWKPRKARKT